MFNPNNKMNNQLKTQYCYLIKKIYYLLYCELYIIIIPIYYYILYHIIFNHI